MVNIADIQGKVAQGLFEFSKHAVDQSVIRHIGVQEVREGIASGKVIEDYSDDKYGPSCLIGFYNGPETVTYTMQLSVTTLDKDCDPL